MQGPHPTLERAIANAERALERSQAELERLDARVVLAAKDAARLTKVVDEHLPVLIGARNLLSVATTDAQDAHTTLQQPIDDADEALGRGQEILALGDVPSFEAEIRACASSSSAPTAVSGPSGVVR